MGHDFCQHLVPLPSQKRFICAYQHITYQETHTLQHLEHWPGCKRWRYKHCTTAIKSDGKPSTCATYTILSKLYRGFLLPRSALSSEYTCFSTPAFLRNPQNGLVRLQSPSWHPWPAVSYHLLSLAPRRLYLHLCRTGMRARCSRSPD